MDVYVYMFLKVSVYCHQPRSI